MTRRSSVLPVRSVLFWPAGLALALTLGTITLAAQAQPASQAPAPAAAPAKWIPPVKGLATAEVLRGPSRKVGNEMVTVLQVKNTSKGAIALLGVEEVWYDNSTPRKIVTGDQQKVKRLINPGEVAEVTMKSPYKPGIAVSQYVFTHANGKVEAKAVKKFTE
jgi:hypothetical protein